MKLRHSIIAAVLSLVIIALPLGAQQHRSPEQEQEGWPKAEIKPGMSDAEVVAALGAFLDAAAAQDRFSGTVLLAKDFKPLMSRAWGSADPARGIANKPDTTFNLGSINKIFTQVAIGQLAQAGKLSPEDTIRKHLPDFPSPAADRITIQQLIEHRSGLGDVFGPEYEKVHASLRKLSDYVPLFAGKPLSFEPGSSQRYSNAGYIVLGLIIEKLSGQSYYDYVRDHITRPAGMTATESYAVDAAVPNRAVGLTARGPEGPLAKRQSNINTLPGRGSSAGGGFSTASDLLRFSQALLGEKLLDAKWTGWIFQSMPGGAADKRDLGIAGGSPGVNAVLILSPPYTVVILSNYDPPTAEIVARTARQMLGKGRPAVAQMQRRPMTEPEGPGEVLMRGPVTLPMTLDGHLPVIEAKINGKGPYHLGVDTGFGGTLELSAALAEELKLPVVGEGIAADPSGKNTRSMKVVHLDSVDVGSAHFGDFDASTMSGPALSHVDGILGLSFFKSLVVTFDYPQSTFALRGGTLPDADGRSVLAYTTGRGGVPNIEIDVAGQKAQTDIDSGSPAEVSLPLSLAKSLPLDGEPQVVGHARTGSNEFEIYGAALRGAVRIGDLVLTNPRVDFVEIFPVGNLGFRFLKNAVVTFDPANKRVKFGRVKDKE
jgi:CubicO group peptidase (beta-lactamase class C family)